LAQGDFHAPVKLLDRLALPDAGLQKLQIVRHVLVVRLLALRLQERGTRALVVAAQQIGVALVV
jgi:hypothetical protein